MKQFLRVAMATVAFVGVFSLAAADTPSNVFHKLAVQKLVAAETAVANLALAAHFRAVADRYLEEAARHRATAAVVYTVHANRAVATTAGSHCEREAALATRWAAQARELAAYHVEHAAGRPAVLPMGATELWAGRGAPEPTPDQLHKLALLARTRSDHLELAEYYATVAKNAAATAQDRRRMATAYRAGIRSSMFDVAFTWDRLARLANKEATKAEEAANRHKQLATIG
jgi:hypothetical protein